MEGVQPWPESAYSFPFPVTAAAYPYCAVSRYSPSLAMSRRLSPLFSQQLAAASVSARPTLFFPLSANPLFLRPAWANAVLLSPHRPLSLLLSLCISPSHVSSLEANNGCSTVQELVLVLVLSAGAAASATPSLKVVVHLCVALVPQSWCSRVPS